MQPNSSKLNLIEQQKALFAKIFNRSDNEWKILIFDQPNHDIVSSLFKLKDFRQNNITLYFNIKQQREQLHGVKALYLVRPNMENVDLIVRDVQEGLYSDVNIHFTAEPKPHLLTSFAKNLSQKVKSKGNVIKKVQFSNIGFQCIDRQMCILQDNQEIINMITLLKGQPLFIYSASQQQQVSYLRERLVQSSLYKKNPVENFNSAIKYTKILVFPRNLDLFPILSHGITYSSLIQTLYTFNPSCTKLLQKDFSLDLNDQIWLDRKNMSTSQMDLEKECSRIKAKLNASKNQETSEVYQKNRQVEWHLNNVIDIMKNAGQRRINQFHAVQQDMHCKRMLTSQNKKDFVQLLQTAVNTSDKIRLILSYLLCVDNYDQNQVQEFEQIFPQIKKNGLYCELLQKQNKSNSNQHANSKYIKKLAKGLWKNLLNQQKKYLLIKYLQKTKDLSQKNLSQLGLKLTTLKDLSSVPLHSQVDNTMVYCVGGVCFNEYSNLRTFDQSVVYAGDRLVGWRDWAK